MDGKSVKRMVGFDIKNKDRGEFRAVFATFNVKDSDGDVTLPGAFEDGAVVPVSAYGHGSWDGKLPVGTTKLSNERDVAVADGRFFMDTSHGRDTFLTVKALAEEHLGEWSYGYTPKDYHYGDLNGDNVRFLSKQTVHEVSPVLQGAGLGTRTLETKGRKDPDGQTGGAAYVSAIRSHETGTTMRWDEVKAMNGIPLSANVSDLRSMFAWVNPAGDPESKSSYAIAHHLGVNGPASVRGILVALARLNAGRTSIPDSDRKAVYDHLADHLRDADREPPPFLQDRSGGQMKFNDQLLVALGDVADLTARAQEVVALRASKNRKRLSGASTESLMWLGDSLRDIQAILDTPAEDAAREYIRHVGLTSPHLHNHTGE